MFSSSFFLLVILSFNRHSARVMSMVTSQFDFTDEARAALCPFVGTEGMQCFDGEPLKRTGRQFDATTLKLPRGVGISIDRTTGRLKAVAVQLTYSPETGRTWMDGYTGEMFDIFNEVILSPATKAAATYNASRIQIFRNASEFYAVWRQTYVDGRIRGGLLAKPPNLYKYMKQFSKHDNALVLFQNVVGLYILTINPSTMQLNSFARDALSKLTPAFYPDLYENFIDTWGTHIITKSFIGGMIEEQAKVLRCLSDDEYSSVFRCLAGSTCNFYADRNRIVSKRRLGGNIQVENDHMWKKSLSFAPAMLQVLEMVPWYDLVTDESIKRNLHTIIWHRQKVMDSKAEAEIQLIDARPASCVKVVPHLPANARWEQAGTTIVGGNGAGWYQNQLHFPHDIFVDDSNEPNILIPDCVNNRVILWKKDDTNKQVVAGGNGKGNRLDQLHHPVCALMDKMTNSFIISDRENRRVVRWFLRSGTTQGEILIHNVYCEGLAMDEERNLYVSNAERNEVRRYEMDRGDTKGILVAGGNGLGSGLNQFHYPRSLFVDRNQSLYVSDHINHRVMKWNKGATQGVIVAGGQGSGSSLTQISTPFGIFVDTLGTLYVAEGENHRVTRWPLGAKQGNVVVGGNGRGTGANQFNVLYGVSFDRHGHLYVVDSGNHRVQRFNLLK